MKAPVFLISAIISHVIAQTNDTLINPVTRFSNLSLSFPEYTGYPVLQSSFAVPPDCGETSYIGHNRLPGRRALITGGDSGIGRATAIAFAKEGAQVAINYLPEEEEDAQDLANILEAQGYTLERIPGDLLNETFCAELVREAHDRLGGLDIVVNNAGYGGFQSGPNYRNISEHSTEQLERVFRTNFFAPFFISRAAVPLLPPGSSIIFTASGLASNPVSNALDYQASKAAIVNFVQGLAQQVASLGIRVNGIAPALCYSPFPVANGDTWEEIQPYLSSTALGRIEQPVELAPLFVGLAQEDTTHTTGSIWGAHGAASGGF